MSNRNFARINLAAFERLRNEVARWLDPAELHEGEIIAQRAPDDQRPTAFLGWSAGRSAKDLASRLHFSIRSRQRASEQADERRKGRAWRFPDEARPSSHRALRIIFLDEAVHRMLCSMASIQDQLMEIERAQQPRSRRQSATGQLKLETARSAGNSTTATTGGPCGCLEFAYLEVKS